MQLPQSVNSCWDLSIAELAQAAPRVGALRVNSHAQDPRVMGQILRGLERFEVFGNLSPADKARRINVLRAIRMETFCGYFMPPCSLELFQLAVRWTTILWLTDDTLDKADSKGALAHAISAHRSDLLPAISGGLAPPQQMALARYVADYFECFRQHASSEVVEALRASAWSWLVEGALPFAESTLEERSLAPEEHVQMRRWDGAVDCCQVNMAACLPSLDKRYLQAPRVREIRALGAIHVSLLNDLVSYEQEVSTVEASKAFRADTNIIVTLQRQLGFDMNSSVTWVVRRLARTKRRYLQLLREVATCFSSEHPGQREDALAFALGVGRMMDGNLQWSLLSERYRSRNAPLSFLRNDFDNQFESLLSLDSVRPDPPPA